MEFQIMRAMKGLGIVFKINIKKMPKKHIKLHKIT
jgi:hypothetical protein